MTVKPFRATHANLKYITSADTFFSTVREEFPSYKKTGLFRKSGKESVFIYRIYGELRNHTGIITGVNIQEYIDGNIKKHEHTLANKEQQQIHLLLLREAQVKPILLAIRSNESLSDFIENNIEGVSPSFHLSFEDDNSKHCFWEVSDSVELEKLQKIFRDTVPTAYIADGHHRIAAQATMFSRSESEGELDFSHIIGAFFPADELAIWDFNRIIDAFEDMSPTMFMAKLSQLFDIEILDTLRKPERRHEIIMVTKNEIYSLKWRPQLIEEYYDDKVLLDVKMLNEKVLRDILGITDVRTDTRVRYAEGVRGPEKVREKVLKNDNRLGFILYPVQMEDFMTLADADMMLPPKSTWFEPRMKNGIVVKEF